MPHIRKPFKIPGRKNYYIEIGRRRISLKTSDKVAAKIKYLELLKQHPPRKNKDGDVRSQREILTTIKDLIDKILSKETIEGIAQAQLNDQGKLFNTEKDMQRQVLRNMKDNEMIDDYDEFVYCDVGIVDATAKVGSEKIIIEFKNDSIRESHFGQCFRYAMSEELLADELWIIGTGKKNSQFSALDSNLFPIPLRQFIVTKNNEIGDGFEVLEEIVIHNA